MLEGTVEVPFRYKTLHDGLKLNHPRKVAIMHPLSFIARRILLAFVVVHMNSVRHTGLFIMIACTLGMLAYACTEH